MHNEEAFVQRYITMWNKESTMNNDTNFAMSNDGTVYIMANFPLSDSTDKTDVEKNLERATRMSEIAEKHLHSCTRKYDELYDKLTALKQAYEKDCADIDKEMRFANKLMRLHTAELAKLKKESSVYRLMNDIRLGKILPVVAETGNIANVTFS